VNTHPVDVDLPHQLGKSEARRRIEGGFSRLAEWVPGGAVSENRWDGDSLHFVVSAMGQRVAARLDVSEANVHAHLELPPFLGMLAGPLRDKLREKGPELLR
jgi:hypothetical protein